MDSVDRILRVVLALTIAVASLAAPHSASALDAGAAPPPAPTARAPRTLDAPSTCRGCHGTLSDPKLRAPALELATSAHKDERIDCTGCHQGDPRDPTVAAHKAAGFRAHPSPAEIPALCGRCHDNAPFMQGFGVHPSTGEAALYGLSVHGKLVANGDPGAPTCVSCHGSHAITPPTDPGSRVGRAGVEKVCAGCHTDRERMSRYGIASDQADEWERSVHGRAFAQGNVNAPTCTGCHAPHATPRVGAAAPDRACTRCHEDEFAFFQESLHSTAFRQRGLAVCASCHGTHDVGPATAGLVGTSAGSACMKCHGLNEKPRKVADDVAAVVRGAQGRGLGAREAVARAKDTGIYVSGASFALDRVATAELKMRAVVHTLDLAKISRSAADVDAAVDETLRQVAQAERQRRVERRGAAVALGLAVLLFVSLALKSMQLAKRRRREEP